MRQQDRVDERRTLIYGGIYLVPFLGIVPVYFHCSGSCQTFSRGGIAINAKNAEYAYIFIIHKIRDELG